MNRESIENTLSSIGIKVLLNIPLRKIQIKEKYNYLHNGTKTTEKNESTLKKNIDVTSKILRKRFHCIILYFKYKTLTFPYTMEFQITLLL